MHISLPRYKPEVPKTPFSGGSSVAHRTYNTYLVPGLLIYYKRIQRSNSQAEEMHSVRYVGRGAHALSRNAWFHKFPCVHQSGHSLNSLFLWFYGGFIA